MLYSVLSYTQKLCRLSSGVAVFVCFPLDCRFARVGAKSQRTAAYNVLVCVWVRLNSCVKAVKSLLWLFCSVQHYRSHDAPQPRRVFFLFQGLCPSIAPSHKATQLSHMAESIFSLKYQRHSFHSTYAPPTFT